MPARATELEHRPSWVARLSNLVPNWVRQLLAPIDVAVSGGWGGAFARVWPSYNRRKALSASAAFAWVRAATRAKVDDVGGLPIIAVRGVEGEERVPDHPFLRLIKRPSPGVTKTRLIRQLEADLMLTGDLYLWLKVLGPNDFEVYRLHPNHVSAEVTNGVQTGWRYGEKFLSLLEVFHTHDISWSDDLTMLFGESAIRTLHDALTAVKQFRQHIANQSEQGRPDVVITLEGNSNGNNGPDKVRDAYEQSMAEGHPAFVVNKGVSVEQMTWSPRELEGSVLDDKVRDETIAVLRVPPTRVGIPQANFATARAELQDYWTSLVNSDLQLIAEVLTEIAHAVGGSLDTEIRFDTSGVAVLQTSYDQRQARAGFWVTVMGAEPAEAAAYEGFKGAPTGKRVEGATPTKHPAKPEKDLSRQGQLERVLTSWLALAAERMEGDQPDATTEAWGLAGVLHMAGLQRTEALELAREVCGIVCEVAVLAHRPLCELYPFSQAYARQVAQRWGKPPEAMAAK